MADACLASLDALIAALKSGAVAGDVAAAADRAWPEAIARYVWHGYQASQQHPGHILVTFVADR
jgi:hypothetical protein